MPVAGDVDPLSLYTSELQQLPVFPSSLLFLLLQL